MSRIIPWVDPITGKELHIDENSLCSSNTKYEIKDGIPNFIPKIDDKGQEQVQDSFSFK
jgi:hypothetical protein